MKGKVRYNRPTCKKSLTSPEFDLEPCVYSYLLLETKQIDPLQLHMDVTFMSQTVRRPAVQ